MGSMITANYDSETDQIIDASPRLNNGVANSSVPITAILSDQWVGNYAVSLVFEYPDFAPCILASFVAGTTAAQTGTTVTVSATAHGIVGNTSHNGYRIYYPGSPSIPAGWYGGFTYVNANTITFQRSTTAEVSSESVNGGAALTGVFVVACSKLIPGGSIGNYGSLEARLVRGGDSSAGVKYARHLIDNNITSGSATTTSPNISCSLSVYNRGSESMQVFTGGVDGGASTSKQFLSVNTAVDFIDAISLGVSNAAQWTSLDFAELRIVRR